MKVLNKNNINISATVEEYNNKMKNINQENRLKGIHMNIRNAKRNGDYFKVMLQEINQKIDIIGWSETWLNREEAIDYGIKYDEYEWIWCETKFNRNGGVGIAVNKELNFKILEDWGNKLEADHLIIEIQDDNKNSYV